MEPPRLELIACALAFVSIAPCLYLLALVPPAIVARVRAARAPGGRGAVGHLVFVVPAHDERLHIVATLTSLLSIVDADCSIHVVADNCTDDTAARVRAWAATHDVPTVVWERRHETERAKGYALAWVLPQVFTWADARATPAAFVCILDADATLTPGSVARARRAFAEGHAVLQSEYVFNEGLGFRADLMRLAAAGFVVRGLARAALGLSDTLKGNGMWFRREVLTEIPWCAFSLAEDLEYSIAILEQGYRVRVLCGSRVSGKLAADAKGETDQRLRWEGGRWAVVRATIGAQLRALVRRPSLQRLDLVIELLIPPIGLLVALQAVVMVVLAWLPGVAWAAIPAGWGALGAFVVAGVCLAGLPLRTLFALPYVPVYILWKLLLLPRILAASRSGQWVRTSR